MSGPKGLELLIDAYGHHSAVELYLSCGLHATNSRRQFHVEIRCSACISGCRSLNSESYFLHHLVCYPGLFMQGKSSPLHSCICPSRLYERKWPPLKAVQDTFSLCSWYGEGYFSETCCYYWRHVSSIRYDKCRQISGITTWRQSLLHLLGLSFHKAPLTRLSKSRCVSRRD